MNYIPYNHDCIYSTNAKNYEKIYSQIFDLLSSVEKKNEDNSLIQNHIQVLLIMIYQAFQPLIQQ